MGLSALGLGLVVGVPGTGDRNGAGLILAAGAGALYAVYLLASTGHMALVSAVLFAGLAANSGGLRVPDTAGQWGVILGLAVLGTLIAVPALYGAIARLGAARAGLIATLEPLFTLLLAFLILGEALGPACCWAGR